MPAPPSALIRLLRKGKAARHLFFYLNHPGGAVLAWDGIGRRTLNGLVYEGIGGLASIDALSNSADIQNHQPTLTLNRVPLTAMTANTAGVRNAAASIIAAWFSPGGDLIEQRTLFVGLGDTLSTKIEEDTLTLTVKLKGKLADWALAPRAYYTDADQRALFADDTGLSLVRSLENATVSGWSINVESSGGLIGNIGYCLFDTGSGELMWAAGVGVWAGNRTPGNIWNMGFTGGTFYDLIEETTTAANGGGATVSTYLQFGGANAYVDASGDARTAGGKLVYPKTFTTAAKLKKLTAIASNGTATAETVDTIGNIATVGGNQHGAFKRSGGTFNIPINNSTGAIVDSRAGLLLYRITGGALYNVASFTSVPTAATYVEDVTNAAVSVVSGKLTVGGVNCVISSTGVVLSAGGRRIKRSGANSATDFLRVVS